ncbi:hypothetical protein Tco_1341902 [Tanacetum coccineum]
MALLPREQRHQHLRYEGLQYSDVDIVDFKVRLARIYMREVHRVQVFNFGGLPDLVAERLSARMLMEHRDTQGASLERLYLIWTQLEPYIFSWEELGGAKSARQIPDKGDLRDYWIGISSAGDFLGTAPSYTSIRDPILRMCHRLIACSIAGKSQAHEKICMEIDDTWDWVAQGPERQPDVAAGAHKAVEDAPVVDEDMPQAVLPPPRTQGERIAQLEEEVHGMREMLQGQRPRERNIDEYWWGIYKSGDLKVLES